MIIVIPLHQLFRSNLLLSTHSTLHPIFLNPWRTICAAHMLLCVWCPTRAGPTWWWPHLLKNICSNTYQWPITPQKWAGVCVNHCLMQKEASLIRNKKYTNLYIGGSTDTNNIDCCQCFQCMHSFHTLCWYIVCLEIVQVLCILSQMLWVPMCTCPAVSRKKLFSCMFPSPLTLILFLKLLHQSSLSVERKG